jgi:hypothetical protein
LARIPRNVVNEVSVHFSIYSTLYSRPSDLLSWSRSGVVWAAFAGRFTDYLAAGAICLIAPPKIWHAPSLCSCIAWRRLCDIEMRGRDSTGVKENMAVRWSCTQQGWRLVAVSAHCFMLFRAPCSTSAIVGLPRVHNPMLASITSYNIYAHIWCYGRRGWR